MAIEWERHFYVIFSDPLYELLNTFEISKNLRVFLYSLLQNGRMLFQDLARFYHSYICKHTTRDLMKVFHVQSTPLSRRRLSRFSLESITISWNIPISSNFHVKLQLLSRCRLSRHDGQVDLLILVQVRSVL